MVGASDLTKMVPGFEFLQGLVKTAGATLPAMGQWVAPTLDPAELGKRIDELRTVQFWLEQNARLLGTTIQALEVQRMTLATLQSMNLPLTDLRESLKISVPPAPALAPAPAPAPVAAAPATAAQPGAGGAVDPLQWWGALTQQFGELTAKAMQDGAMPKLAGPAVAPTKAKPAKAAAKPAARKRAR